MNQGPDFGGGPSGPVVCPDPVGDDADPFGFSIEGGLGLSPFMLDIAQHAATDRDAGGPFLLAVTDGVTIVASIAMSGIAGLGPWRRSRAGGAG